MLNSPQQFFFNKNRAALCCLALSQGTQSFDSFESVDLASSPAAKDSLLSLAVKVVTYCFFFVVTNCRSPF